MKLQVMEIVGTELEIPAANLFFLFIFLIVYREFCLKKFDDYY
jgi:hypothetical protein